MIEVKIRFLTFRFLMLSCRFLIIYSQSPESYQYQFLVIQAFKKETNYISSFSKQNKNLICIYIDYQ